MLGCGWMRFAINKELSGHAELWFRIQNCVSFTWHKRIKRKSKQLLDSGAASSLCGSRNISRLSHKNLPFWFWCPLPSFLTQALLLACGMWPFALRQSESFEDYLRTPLSTARWPVGMGSGRHVSLPVWRLLVNMGCKTLLGLHQDMLRQ